MAQADGLDGSRRCDDLSILIRRYKMKLPNTPEEGCEEYIVGCGWITAAIVLAIVLGARLLLGG